MRSANKEFKFRGPSKLLDFRNTDVVDIASVIDKDLPIVQEVEKEMIADINKETCTTEVNVGTIVLHLSNRIILLF